MESHPSKCQHISFTRKRSPSSLNLSLHSTVIPKADKIKYLGVMVDSKLTWTSHVSSTIAKANSTLGFIRRNVTTKSSDVKALAYKQLVRPVLEYAAASWDSLTQTQEKDLEAVQRRAARLVGNIPRTDRTTSITELVHSLSWDKLADRRQDRRLKIFRDMHFGDENVICQYLQPSSNTSLRRHSQQYMIPHSRTQHHQRSYFVRTAKDWNSLPPSSQLLVPPSISN
jgi:hypothetical protein